MTIDEQPTPHDANSAVQPLAGEQPDSEEGRRQRSRFRVVTVHLLKSAVLPFPVKWILFAIIMSAVPRPVLAVLIWVTASCAVYAYAVRRSMTTIHRTTILSDPQKCVLPSLIIIGLLSLFGFVVDIGALADAVRRPWLVAAGAWLGSFFNFIYLSLRTQRGFMAMPGARNQNTITVESVIVAAADLFVVGGMIVIISIILTT